jgi:3-oxoadipate enol-lactonase
VKVRLGDIDVAYTASGDGPAVVLIHGLAEDRTSWTPVLRRLTGYRCYAYDLRGHGETTLGRPDETLSQLGGDLARFLETVAGQAACVGFSLGGAIVLWTAGERTDLVRHAVAAGTSSVVGRAAAGVFEARIGALQHDAAAFARELRADTAAQLTGGDAHLDAVTARRLAAIGEGGGYINAARAMLRLRADPLTPMLGRIRCTVDIIGGERDTVCPPKAAEILLAGLPAGRYHEIAGAGHLLSIDAPEAYARTIQACLDEGGEER